jgi:hypothetical protein
MPKHDDSGLYARDKASTCQYTVYTSSGIINAERIQL